MSLKTKRASELEQLKKLSETTNVLVEDNGTMKRYSAESLHTTTWNEVLGKPFREEYIDLIPNGTVLEGFVEEDPAWHEGKQVFSASLSQHTRVPEGTVVEIEWDGILYQVVSRENTILGNKHLNNPEMEDTGEPFCFMFHRQYSACHTSDPGESHVVSIGAKCTTIEESDFVKIDNSFTVSFMYDGGTEVITSDKTYNEILDAYNSGKSISVILYNDSVYRPLITLADEQIILDDRFGQYVIYSDDTVEWIDIYPSMIVNLSTNENGEVVADKEFNEILNAIHNGTTVVASNPDIGLVLNLSSFSDEAILFNSSAYLVVEGEVTNTMIESVLIYANGTIEAGEYIAAGGIPSEDRINALIDTKLESFPKTVNGIVPDENGNIEVPGGISSWNDLTDKPFYDIEELIIDTVAQNAGYDSQAGWPSFGGSHVLTERLVVGDRYAVEINGYRILATAYEHGGAPCLGDGYIHNHQLPSITNPYPRGFCIINGYDVYASLTLGDDMCDENDNPIYDENGEVVNFGDADSVTLKIFHLSTKTIDDKYLPKIEYDYNGNATSTNIVEEFNKLILALRRSAYIPQKYAT